MGGGLAGSLGGGAAALGAAALGKSRLGVSPSDPKMDDKAAGGGAKSTAAAETAVKKPPAYAAEVALLWRVRVRAREIVRAHSGGWGG